MGHYKLTRQEVADLLTISVRSIDRYIKAGKLRAKKKWKIVYVHTEDVENISGKSDKKVHVIISGKEDKKESWQSKEVLNSKQSYAPSKVSEITQTFEKVYTDLRAQIDQKDEVIQKLSVQVGQSQEQVKHSISISEHNRTQMLLEESKDHMNSQLDSLSQMNTSLEKTIKDEKFDKFVLIIFVFILLWAAWYFWFKSI